MPDTLIIQAKVTIQDIQPEIWRRLLLPPELNLALLHEVLQAAFGWTDSHLHQFIIGGLVYGAPEFDQDGLSDNTTFEATSVRLLDFDFYHVPQPSFLYHYDFGDSWRHLVDVEARIPQDPSLKYPVCIAGARRAPPEDVGGTHGYMNFLEAWHDRAHEEHKANRRWAGRAFDPEKCDLAAINKAITSRLRKARGDYISRTH